MFPFQEAGERSQSEECVDKNFCHVWRRIELYSNSQLVATKEIYSVETRNTNKEEMLESFLTFANSNHSGKIISPNTIIEYSTYWGEHALKQDM